MKEQIKSVLITGANAGLGKEAARQFALESDVEKIYLACRNLEKGQKAMVELEQKTGKKKFELIQMDVAKVKSVQQAVDKLPESVDAVVMNAGGFGDKNAHELTEDGVTQIFAVNVLGHVALVNRLLEQQKLNKVAVYVSSEVARGVKALSAEAPNLKTHSSEELKDIATGKFFEKWDAMKVYGYVKYVGTLWLSSLAEKYPNIRFASVSPGSTSGTNAADNFPFMMRIMFKYVMFPIVLKMKGLVHNTEKGAKRYVDVTLDNTYNSGNFYGSKADTLIGTLVNQGELLESLTNKTYQQNANETVNKLIKA